MFIKQQPAHLARLLFFYSLHLQGRFTVAALLLFVALIVMQHTQPVPVLSCHEQTEGKLALFNICDQFLPAKGTRAKFFRTELV